MVDGISGGEGFPKLDNGQSSDRGSDDNSRLSVQSCDQEGDNRDSIIRNDGQNDVTDSSLSHDDGRSTTGDSGRSNNNAVIRDGGGLLLSKHWDGFDGTRSKKRIVQSPKKTIDAEFANVSDGYRGSSEEATPGTTEIRLREGDGVLDNQYVEELVEGLPDAIKKLKQIIREEEWDPVTNQKFISIQRQASKDYIDSAMKLHDDIFKKKQNDGLEKILAALLEKKAEMGFQ